MKYRFRNFVYKIMLTMTTVVPFASCDDSGCMQITTGRPNYRVVYMDWDKFKCQSGEENPVFIDLENRINSVLERDEEIKHIVIKTCNKDRTLDLSAHDWNQGVRKGFEELTQEYLQRKKPVSVCVNDTVEVFDKNLPLGSVEEKGITKEDDRVMKYYGLITKEKNLIVDTLAQVKSKKLYE